ncbi:hypothetical protein [Shewanella algae]|uniref:hypothetical protein n=1 Tax=Shewanella algae TaxID=38313 RepID=UPI0031F512E5
MFKKILIIFLFVLPNTVSAISVSKMLVLADRNGRAIITLTNPDEQAVYIKLRVFEVVTHNGETKKIEYTENNFPEWKIRLNTYKTILDPGRVKDVTVESLCSSKCNYEKDLSFFVYIEPYIPAEKRTNSGVVVNYGYAPLVIIPTDNDNYKFEVKNLKSSIVLKNVGNKVINFEVNHCTIDLKSDSCSFNTLVLPGRVRNLALPESFKDKKLKVTAYGVDNIYKSEGIYKVLQ